jgi:hypothetical protein
MEQFREVWETESQEPEGHLAGPRALSAQPIVGCAAYRVWFAIRKQEAKRPSLRPDLEAGKRGSRWTLAIVRCLQLIWH